MTFGDISLKTFKCGREKKPKRNLAFCTINSYTILLRRACMFLTQVLYVSNVNPHYWQTMYYWVPTKTCCVKLKKMNMTYTNVLNSKSEFVFWNILLSGFHVCFEHILTAQTLEDWPMTLQTIALQTRSDKYVSMALCLSLKTFLKRKNNIHKSLRSCQKLCSDIDC